MYKRQPSDSVPTNPVAVAVALADKLDTLVGFWAIDEKPTGSKDPFALRRAALGVVRIILENDVRLELLREVSSALTLVPGKLAEDFLSAEKLVVEERATSKGEQISTDSEGFKKISEWHDDLSHVSMTLFAFILERMVVHLKGQEVSQDHLEAIISKVYFGNLRNDLCDIVNRVTALQSFLDTPDGENLLAGYKRAANILKAEAKKGELPAGDIGILSQSEAVALQTGLTNSKAKIEAALASESYAAAMTALSELRRPIDDFFENVMVVSEDEETRKNNLSLLMLIRDTARQIADFDRISG